MTIFCRCYSWVNSNGMRDYETARGMSTDICCEVAGTETVRATGGNTLSCCAVENSKPYTKTKCDFNFGSGSQVVCTISWVSLWPINKWIAECRVVTRNLQLVHCELQLMMSCDGVQSLLPCQTHTIFVCVVCCYFFSHGKWFYNEQMENDWCVIFPYFFHGQFEVVWESCGNTRGLV